MDRKESEDKTHETHEEELGVPQDVALTHPIYKKLAKINGNINNMDINQLRQQLNQMNLEVRSETSSNSCYLKYLYLI